MGFDLSAVDAELEQLGRVPENPLQLAQTFVSGLDPRTGSLAQIDDELSALAHRSGVEEPLYVTRPQRAPSFARSTDLRAPAIPHVTTRAESEPARRRSSIPLPPAQQTAVEDDSVHLAQIVQADSVPPAASERPQASALDMHAEDEGLSHLEDSEWPAALEQPGFVSDLARSTAPEGDNRRSSHPDSLRPDSLRPDSLRPDSLRPDSAAPAPQGREAAPLTQSQEIVLPDPIPHEELSTESGELSLDSPRPGSGSYSLDAPPSSGRPPEQAPSISVRPSDSGLGQRGERSGAHDFANMVDDDVQDALEGSQPLSMGAPATISRATPSMDRDPDAEFDALLSEATDPRGMPVISGELDTDALLRGLEMDELEPEEAHTLEESEADQATHEADELARSLYDEHDESEPDSTEILDRASALAIEAQAPGEAGDKLGDEFALDAELDSGELEIMLDDDAPEPAAARAPESASRPPKAPPPPPGATEKRPSILGRLFGGKRDGE